MPGPDLCCICRRAATHGMDADGDSAWPRCRAAPLQARPEKAASQHDLHTILGHLPPGTLDLTAFAGTIDEDRVGIVDVDIDTPCGQSNERAQRPIFAVDRHVTHAMSGFLSGPGA